MAISLPSGYAFGPLQPDAPYFDGAVRLYLATWPGADVRAVADFFARYFALPDYRGLVASVGEKVMAYGFGVRSLPGNWWHDKVAEQVGAEHPALQDAWALVSLATTPEHRRRGLASSLMETLLASQPCPRVLLSTEVTNAPARRLYERHGWTYLHEGFVFKPGDPAFVVMKRDLRAHP